MTWLKRFLKKLFPEEAPRFCDRCRRNLAVVNFEGRALCEDCYCDIVSKRS